VQHVKLCHPSMLLVGSAVTSISIAACNASKLPAGVLTLKYAEIKPDHLSMLLMGLNAYPEARFSSKLQRLLLECCVHMPLEQFEVRSRTQLVSWLVPTLVGAVAAQSACCSSAACTCPWSSSWSEQVAEMQCPGALKSNTS